MAKPTDKPTATHVAGMVALLKSKGIPAAAVAQMVKASTRQSISDDIIQWIKDNKQSI